MKAERLFEAIGMVEDHLIEEAAEARRGPSHWRSWAAMAACLVVVLGIGSVSMSLLFRGCGAKSEAPEMSADCAPAESQNASSGAPATEEIEADMPADMPAEEPGEPMAPGDGNGMGITTPFTSYEGPILPLNADGEALEAERALRLEVADDGEAVRVIDHYTVRSTADHDQTVTFRYPMAVSLNGFAETGLTVSVDGREAEVTAEAGPSAGYSEDGMNLGFVTDWNGWAELISQGAVEPDTGDQTVTVWTVSDVRYPADAVSGASLALAFSLPEGTEVWTNGFNGGGTKDGQTVYDFFVQRPDWDSHDLIFLGTAPESFTMRGYTDGGLTEELAGVSGVVTKRTTTLKAYLDGICGSDLERRLAMEEMTGGVPRYSVIGRMLEMLLGDVRAAQRVCYGAFEVRIPAGGTVEITASYSKTTSFNFPPDTEMGLRGVEVLPWVGGLPNCSQTAELVLPAGVTIRGDTFGFAENGGPVTLEPERAQYELLLEIS